MNQDREIKVSVVLPAYNAEWTLARMVDSLLVQTLTDFELLIVDDGSTDGTAALCDAYAARDSRVRVFHQPNGGVSAARQLGVDQARGEYSIHADADDWVEPTMLEEMYAKAKETDADVVIADFFTTGKDGKEKYVCQEPEGMDGTSMLRGLFQNLYGSLWHKLVRHCCYTQYGLRFEAGVNYCEDFLVCAQLFVHPEVKGAYLPKPFYHYDYNPSSITKNGNRGTYENHVRFVEALKDLLDGSEWVEHLHNFEYSTFLHGIAFDVLTDEEVKLGLQTYKEQINKTKSMRWQLGFWCLSHGFRSISHKLIHF